MDATAGTSIAISLRMAKAMSLARSGKIREAQSLIAGDRTIPDHPLALHALASLVTSEGDYLRALKLWELLLQREPHHAEARRMVDSIELWLSRPAWMRYWPLAASTLVAVIAAAIFWVFAASGPRSAPGTPARPTPTEASPFTASPRPTQPPVRATPTPALKSSPPPAVSFPGVSTGTNQQQRRKTNSRETR
jgi:hypothetical protein